MKQLVEIDFPFIRFIFDKSPSKRAKRQKGEEKYNR
jgi:hypothetical protein